jgi:hypothetical protein
MKGARLTSELTCAAFAVHKVESAVFIIIIIIIIIIINVIINIIPLFSFFSSSFHPHSIASVIIPAILSFYRVFHAPVPSRSYLPRCRCIICFVPVFERLVFLLSYFLRHGKGHQHFLPSLRNQPMCQIHVSLHFADQILLFWATG